MTTAARALAEFAATALDPSRAEGIFRRLIELEKVENLREMRFH